MDILSEMVMGVLVYAICREDGEMKAFEKLRRARTPLVLRGGKR